MATSGKKESSLSKFENHLLKKVGKAMIDYGMVGKNDRILVGVSGGKDSMSMLRLLLLKNRQMPPSKKYSLIAAHVKFDVCNYDIKNLEDFFKSTGVEYHIEKATLPQKNDPKLSSCFWCSWNRRKHLFTLAQKFSCNKIALAHHMDDIVETLLMNQFFYGEISTMPPKISMFKGEFDIIRPLVHIKEKSLLEYATRLNLSFFTCTCPFLKNDSRRKFIKGLISDLEKKCPFVKINLFRSMKRIKPRFLV